MNDYRKPPGVLAGSLLALIFWPSLLGGLLFAVLFFTSDTYSIDDLFFKSTWGVLALILLGLAAFIRSVNRARVKNIIAKMRVPLEKISKQAELLKASGFNVDYTIIGSPGVVFDRTARKVAFVYPDSYKTYSFSDIRYYRLVENYHSYSGKITSDGTIYTGGSYSTPTHCIEFKIKDIDGTEIEVAVLSITDNDILFDVPQAKKLVTDTLPFIFS